MKHTHSYTFSATTQNPLRSNYSFLFITSSNGMVYLVKEAAKTNSSPSNPNDVPQNERRRSSSLMKVNVFDDQLQVSLGGGAKHCPWAISFLETLTLVDLGS